MRKTAIRQVQVLVQLPLHGTIEIYSLMFIDTAFCLTGALYKIHSDMYETNKERKKERKYFPEKGESPQEIFGRVLYMMWWPVIWQEQESTMALKMGLTMCSKERWQGSLTYSTPGEGSIPALYTVEVILAIGMTQHAAEVNEIPHLVQIMICSVPSYA